VGAADEQQRARSWRTPHRRALGNDGGPQASQRRLGRALRSKRRGVVMRLSARESPVLRRAQRDGDDEGGEDEPKRHPAPAT
jgi:hypothetical protein